MNHFAFITILMRLLILYHYNGLSAEELFDDMARRYPGQFVVGRDLDVY